jgi:hypothetical protein
MPGVASTVATTVFTSIGFRERLMMAMAVSRAETFLVPSSFVAGMPLWAIYGYRFDFGRCWMRLTGNDLAARGDLLLELIRRASDTPAPTDE